GAEGGVEVRALHADGKVRDRSPTPSASLSRARRSALANGVRYAYTGNVHDRDGQSTWCHACGALLIERDWYELGAWNLTADGRCAACGSACAGVLEARPGGWAAQRVPGPGGAGSAGRPPRPAASFRRGATSWPTPATGRPLPPPRPPPPGSPAPAAPH